MQCQVIIALILVQVCDGGYGENVMKDGGEVADFSTTTSSRRFKDR
jgi:hypothetical protein